MLEIRVGLGSIVRVVRRLLELGVESVDSISATGGRAVIKAPHSIVFSQHTLGEVADELRREEGVSEVIATPRIEVKRKD